MKLYAERTDRRVRQVVGDVAALLWVVLAVRVAIALHRLISGLAAPGRGVEDAGETFERGVDRAADAVGGVPLAGDVLQHAFGSVAGAGETLADAGRAQQAAVADLALWLSVGLAVVAIAVVLVAYLPRRLWWVREATAAAAIRDADLDLRVLALRAVTNRPLPRIVRAVPDPGAALAAGRYEDLARLELDALGLRTSRS